jgi:epoxyqueuosine reductase QueG
MDLKSHPSVVASRNRQTIEAPLSVSREWVKQLAIESGADDAGVVSVEHPSLADQKEFIISAFPRARTLISFTCRLNTAQIRSKDRSFADSEYVETDKMMTSISRKIVRGLLKRGITSVTPPQGFPQEIMKWPGRMFTVSHKPVAQAAGLGWIGHNRLLIHHSFGSHITLGTIIMDTDTDSHDGEISFNPCISCGLCVSVCPTGAIGADGTFDFFPCLLHTYRDRIGGFVSWTESLVTSRTMEEYRAKRTDAETLAVWQGLATGGGYRCGYCMSVCPAGSDLIGSYIDSRQAYAGEVVQPLKDITENVYVLPGSQSEIRVTKKFPNKTAKHI